MIRIAMDDFSGKMINEGEHRREIKLFSSPNSAISSKDFAFGMSVIEPGRTHEPHEHNLNEEILVVFEGTGVAKIDDEEIPIKRGDLIALDKNERHAFENTSAETLKLLWIYYPPGRAEELFMLFHNDEG